jgi:hypothetical protein
VFFVHVSVYLFIVGVFFFVSSWSWILGEYYYYMCGNCTAAKFD